MEVKEIQNTTPIQQMLEKLSAQTVFGQPATEGDKTVIPVAEVTFGFGYGGGYGRGNNGAGQSTENGHSTATGEGAGSGGGAGGRTTPRGYIRITPDEVKFEPIIDETRIPLAGILMVAWSVFWVMATIRVIAKAVAKTRQQRIKASS
jgi:uncharacterized spore protein YtfJ